MSTFYIQNHADWQSAITFSQNETSIYTHYVLMTDLTFDTDNHMFLNSSMGSQDTDYLCIRGGQIFDGNNHTLTVSAGSETSPPLGEITTTAIPISIGLKGIFRCMGASLSELATITNVKVVVQPGVIIGQSVVVGNISSMPTHFTKYENIIVDTRAVSMKSYSIITAGDRLKGVFFKNIFIYCEGTKIIYACCYGVSEYASFENMIFISGDTNLSAAHFSLCSSVYSGSVAATNCYIAAPYNTSTSALYSFFQFIWDSTSTLQLENAYIGLRTYSTTYTNTASFLVYGVKTTSSTIGFTTIPPLQINLLNCYTNINRTGTLASAFIKTTLPNITVRLQNCQNNFTWNKPAVFTNGFNTGDTGPYRLSSFLSSPFDPNTYPTYISTPGFSQGTIVLPSSNAMSLPPYYTTLLPTTTNAMSLPPYYTTLLPTTTTFPPTATTTTTSLPSHYYTTLLPTTFQPRPTNATSVPHSTTSRPRATNTTSQPHSTTLLPTTFQNTLGSQKQPPSVVAPQKKLPAVVVAAPVKKSPPKTASKVIAPAPPKAKAKTKAKAATTTTKKNVKEKYETIHFANEFANGRREYKTLDTAYQ